MGTTVRVIECHVCGGHTSIDYLRQNGRCWNCWERLDYPKDDKPVTPALPATPTKGEE